MYQCDALDKNGIPRVWGCDSTPAKAETQCRWELMEYLQRPRGQRGEFKYDDFTFKTKRVQQSA